MNCIIRALKITDYSKGYYECLQELTHAPKQDIQGFTQFVDQLNIKPLNKQVLVVEHNDPMTEQISIVGTGSICFEPKSIHGGCLKAYIEDIVVIKDFRGQKVGTQLISTLVEIAKKVGCYKIVLSCKENKRNFYELQGFNNKEVSMDMYLPLDGVSKLNCVSDMTGTKSTEILEGGATSDTSVTIQGMAPIVSSSNTNIGTSQVVLSQVEIINEVSPNASQKAEQPAANSGPSDVTEAPLENNLNNTVGE